MNIRDYIFGNQEYLEDFITRSTYHSNGIEGNTLSFAETYAILFNDNEFKVSAKPREIYEAINHKYAVNYILNHLDEELSEQIIKDIAIMINRNISEISGYRTVPVRIRGAEHVPPAPEQIPQQMMYFVYNYNHTEFDSIYQKLAQMHLQFERIHPFEDGNGRTGRLLLNFELIKNNLAPVVIPKEQRSSYFEMIGNNDSTALEDFLKMLSDEEQERINQMPVKGSVLEKLSGYQKQVKEKDVKDNVVKCEKTEREQKQEIR